MFRGGWHELKEKVNRELKVVDNVHTGVFIDAPPADYIWPTKLHLVQRRAVPCIGHLSQSVVECLSQSSLLYLFM